MNNETQTPSQATPIISPSPIKEKNNKSFFKNKFFLILMGFIVFISIIFAGLNLGLFPGLIQFSAYPIPAPDPATANWKIYQNEDVWFDIKYPDDWFNITKEEANLGKDEKLYEFSNIQEASSSDNERVIVQLMASNSQSQKDLVGELEKTKSEEKMKKDSVVYAKIADVKLANVTAIQYISDKKEKIIFNIKDNVFTASMEGDKNAVKKYRNIFYQILHTFKSYEGLAGEDYDFLYTCKVDSDCVVAPYIHCCGATKQAINKKWDKFYRTHRDFQSFSAINNPGICAQAPKCPDDSEVNEAECIQLPTDDVKTCQLKY